MEASYELHDLRRERLGFSFKSVAAMAVMLLGLASTLTAEADLIEYRADFAIVGPISGEADIAPALNALAGQPLTGRGITILWTIDDSRPPNVLNADAARYQLVGLDLIFQAFEADFVTPVSVFIPGAVSSPSDDDALQVDGPEAPVNSITLVGRTDIPIGSSGAFFTDVLLEVITSDLSILTTLDHPTVEQLNALSAAADAEDGFPNQVRIDYTDGIETGWMRFESTSFSSRVVLAEYTVGGTVSGLVGSGLVLQNNGADDLVITENNPFTFTTALDDGSPYAVTVLSQPVDQTCTVSNGSGVLGGSNVTNVEITCISVSGINILPDVLDFGDQPLGVPTDPLMTVVESLGPAELVLGSITLEGPQRDDFEITLDSCTDMTVPVDDICGIDVVFTPSAAGVRQAWINIPSNAPSSPGRVNVIGTNDVLFLDGFESESTRWVE